MSASRRRTEERREELETIRKGTQRKEPTQKERQRREERKAVAGEPPQEAPSIEETKQRIEEAKEAIKTAESYKQAVGSTITWGEQTYDLGTTQGWKDYQQAIREAKSEVRTAERNVKRYEFQEISRQAPKPATPRITRLDIAETGPPKIATPSDISRLRSEGYDLPEGKTIYISPSGQPYYYEGEIEEPEKSLSRQLWEESEQIDTSEIARFFGVPYSTKGVRQIGAVLTGSVEQSLTPILGLIPGEQPFELMPDEQSFDWRGLGFDDLPKGKLFAARVTGKVTEQALSFGLYSAAAAGGGAVIGASGALVSKLPYVGPALEVGGAWASSILSSGPAQVFFAAPIVAIEWEKVKTMKAEGRAGWEIAAEIEIDAAKLFGTAYGFSSGLSYGKQLPTKMERLLKGGTTVPKEAIVPENVLTGEGRFPRFKSEPFEPTAKGYTQFAEKYTPPELRITEKGIPSYHVTTAPIKGDFTTKPGLRVGTLKYDEALGRFVGRGEYAFWVGPASSTHFARIGSEGYSLTPGVPNIFGGEAKILLGEYAGVEMTGLSKSSAEFANMLKASEGSGKLFMPLEQMGEAQAGLAPGTMMVKVPGDYYTDIGGKTIKIDRFLPKILTDALGVEGPSIPYSEYLSRKAAGASSLVGEQPTTYLPIISSSELLKKADSSLKRVSVSKASSSKISRVSTIESSFKKADSSLNVSSRITSYTPEPSYFSETSYPKSSYPEPDYPSPSYPEPTYPEPSYPDPSYKEPTRTPPSYIPRKRRGPLILTTGKGKKKKKGAFEFRVDFKEPKLPDIGTFKIPGFETGGKKEKRLKMF